MLSQRSHKYSTVFGIYSLFMSKLCFCQLQSVKLRQILTLEKVYVRTYDRNDDLQNV